jgi:hypothetical protein
MRYRRMRFVTVIVAACLAVILAGLLWLSLISVADLDLAGQVPHSFTNWYFLEWTLSLIAAVGLIGSVVLFKTRNAAPPSS